MMAISLLLLLSLPCGPFSVEVEQINSEHGLINQKSESMSNSRGATPILGWNNCQLDCAPVFPNDAIVRSTAVLLRSTGLADAGYTHLNLDDAWMSYQRDLSGSLQPNTTRFPNFTDTLAFVRSLNLSVGLYTAAGDKTCSGKTGSCRHEDTDASQFIQWGISHVKDDACSTCRDPTKKGAAADYTAMMGGLKRAAEKAQVEAPLLMVEGQPPFPEAADGRYGDVRRVGHDINANWLSMLSLVDIGSGLWPYARPGFFNDLEMMELGNGDFVADESAAALGRARAHMTMWSVMKSPLVLSTNLSALGRATLSVATNAIAIGVNQDPLGTQARRVKSTPTSSYQLPRPRRRDLRDVIAVAAKCDARRPTQHWKWSHAVDNHREISSVSAASNPAVVAENGTLYTIDENGFAWCLAMPYSGIWSVVPYAPGNTTHPSACVDGSGEASSWQAKPVPGPRESYAFVWRRGDRPYGFAWGQDLGSSGPLPHTRWLQSNAGGNWTGNLLEAARPGSSGASFSPAAATIIDDDCVGHVGTARGSDFCLDVVHGGNVETWTGALQGGNTVVAVLNRSPVLQQVVVDFSEVGVNVSQHRNVSVESAWGERGRLLPDRSGYACEVAGHSAALLVLS